MPSDKLRLFVAVDVPRAHLEAIELATQPLREEFVDARWAPLDNQHLTVKFLGSTAGELRGDVASVCRDVALDHEGSSVALTGIGAFPSERRMRVLWIGVNDPTGLLARLAAALDEAFAPLGYRTEKRAFTPHLTLARWRVPVRVETTPDVELPPLEPWLVDRLNLYRSHLSPRGATYERLQEFPLNGERVLT